MVRQSQWYLIGLLPLMISALVGALLLGTLYWAAARTDEVAAQRQKDLVTLIVSKFESAVAHDQESATVWDDAVVKTRQRDLDWIDGNLGQWMNTYFGHDAAVVLSPDGPIYEFSVPADNTPSHDELRDAYQPLAKLLRARLISEDQTGISDRVLSIGQSDLTYVGKRPAVVSVKPIISDTGELAQASGDENLHVAVRFLDGGLPAEIGNEYRFADMRFTTNLPSDKNHSTVALTSKSGKVIGYFNWHPFEPGASVFHAILPVLGLTVVAIFAAAGLLGRAIWRRSVKLAMSRRELQQLAHHDALTGLANRAHFKQELTARLEHAAPDEIRSVFFVDLDRFKAVNDTYGHPTGDQLISLVAGRLRGILSQALIARLGGDEFTVLLEGREMEEIGSVADQIVKCLREPFEIDGVHIRVGASVGVAIVTGTADSVEVTRQADIALYHAKAAGRNAYAIFGAHMDELLRTRRQLEHDLREALATKTQFEVAYQPVYSAASDKPCSLEALSRWNHPTMGFIAPDVFIPLAEEIGLIDAIGTMVLEDACCLLAQMPGIEMAVNASALEIGASGYPLRVMSTLAKWKVDSKRLEIEITESLAISGEEQTERNIDVLRAAGVRFAIDDFGTGYSSFSRVQNVTVDRIKIDKSFIGGLHDGRSRALVEAMINMARAQGMKTTAEGVETVEQRDALRSLGCDNLQGYLMSRPITSDEVKRLVAPRERRSRSDNK